MKYLKRSCFLSFFLCLAATPLAAQCIKGVTNYGVLNSWMNKDFYCEDKIQSGSPKILQPRFGRHKGFDRIVFEFEGGRLPGILVENDDNLVEDTDGWEDSNLISKKVLVVSFYMVSVEGTQLDEGGSRLFSIPKREINSPNVNEVINNGFWEGEMQFAIGVKSGKIYRVQQLSNPSRYVIDIKH